MLIIFHYQHILASFIRIIPQHIDNTNTLLDGGVGVGS